MSYPHYKRNGDTFYKVVEEGVITKIEPDAGLDYYSHCGLVVEEAEEMVEGFDDSDVNDWEAVCADVKQCSRVGSRPNIPPPH